MTTRTLLLLRHAKAEEPGAVIDHSRALTERGRRDAARVGEYLLENVGDLDLALISSSLRTQQTWQCVADAGAEASEEWIEDAMYDASADQLLALLRGIGDEVGSVLLVGHAPGVPELADLLAGTGDPDVLDDLVSRFPTAALAVLRFDGSWADLGPEAAELDAFVLGHE